jgi:WD40 repeat protein
MLLHFRIKLCDAVLVRITFFAGSSDGTVRIWEVETGRCLKVWKVGGDVLHIAWNPLPDRAILAAIV